MIYILFFRLGLVNAHYLEPSKIVIFLDFEEKKQKNIAKVTLPYHTPAAHVIDFVECKAFPVEAVA